MEQLSLFSLPKSYEDDGISASASDQSQESGVSLGNDDFSLLRNFIEREDEARYRCLVPDCREVFADETHWRKHVGKQHGEWIEILRKEVPKPSSRSPVEQNRLEESTTEQITREAMDPSGTSQLDKIESPDAERASSGSISKPISANVRAWVDRTGTFKVYGEFLRLEDGRIHIHKVNGIKISVAVNRMSFTDLGYVESVTGQSLVEDNLGQSGTVVGDRKHLNDALEQANEAVRLHDAQRFLEAIQAYSKACRQLDEALVLAKLDEDGKELTLQAESYLERILKLQGDILFGPDDQPIDSREARPDNPQRASGATSLGIDQLHERSAETRAETASRIRSLLQSAENEDHRLRLAAMLDAYDPQ